ncbi:unnamed protein product [Polarella glacialis]|uniref:Uncharacterized protein n=1 Tax=Polarella glacialis TaxID=89957 RepID=A0A813EPG5_POLGL|nr:unnamed protein product [Polarella glacialis]
MPVVASGASSRAPAARISNSRSRSRHRKRRRHRREQSAERTPTPPNKGVWENNPAPVPTQAPEPEAPEASQVHGEELDELRDWLLSLDSGRGALEKYLEPLIREFGNLSALPACLLPASSGGSIVSRIDPSLWAACQIQALGHRLLLSRAIVALAGE